MPPPEPIPDLLKAVNDASGKAFALWITFLTVATYLAISVGTTTHVQLLLEGPVKLPLLDVNMPLFDFYEFAPALFVVLHLYVLMQLYLLSRTLQLFEQELQTPQLIKKDRERIRAQLEKFVFTQFLINQPNPFPIRQFLRATVWLSFIIGPILLLFTFQIRFLPYHSEFTTYVHRIILIVDVVLILVMWPKIYRGIWLIDRPWSVRWLEKGLEGLLCLLLFFASFGLATIPDEFLDQARVKWLRLPGSEFNLDLLGARLVESDQDKLAKLDVTLSLSHRDLRFAELRGADMRKADLRGADLSGAILRGADLSGANLLGAKLINAHLLGAKLTHANLVAAKLDGAFMRNADLSGANLFGAILNHADLANANLTGADLLYAQLQSADLTNANLTGAYLIGAYFNNVKNLAQQQLNQACGTNPESDPMIHAEAPPGLTFHPKPCPER